MLDPGASVRLVIGVTGHRNIDAGESDGIRARVRELFAALRRELPSLAPVVVSSLAQGGDQLVAEEASAAGIPLIAILPMPRAQYADDFEGTARARFDALLATAATIELPGVARDAIDLDAMPTGAERDRQYANAGLYISSHCHILLAIWDGKPSDLIGGTAQIVDYHLHGKLPGSIERRRARSASVPLGDDIERLAYHIVCSRSDEGAPAPALRPLETFWLTGSHATSGENPIPADYRATFANMAGFGADAAKYRQAIEAKSARRAVGVAAPKSALNDLFQAADYLALHFQRRVLFAMRGIYSIAALMGIAFLCYADFPAQDYMIFVFLSLFAAGVSLSLIARRRGWHRKYLDYRALAEGLRVQSYWRRAGLSVTADSEFAHDNFLQKQDVELGWIRNVMRSAGLAADLARAPREADALVRVIAEWVGEADGPGQLGYYTSRAVQRARLHRITETLGAISLWTGIAISVFLAVFFLRLSQDAKTTLVAVMAIVSIVAAVREAYAYR
ncbi:MAG TPA: hypothetical protein VJ696_11120, partial [Rhodanobacteraceae bacterium]|nr:hypothetical protein [Rhodanobacteraceae bacterium]